MLRVCSGLAAKVHDVANDLRFGIRIPGDVYRVGGRRLRKNQRAEKRTEGSKEFRGEMFLHGVSCRVIGKTDTSFQRRHTP